MTEKVQVCNNLEEVEAFLQENKESKVCLYIADKTLEDWEISTSRVYMNTINDKFTYLPVNIKKDDIETIRKLYELSEKNNQIIAINQTQPHKSNLVLKEWFANQSIPANIDSLIKNIDKELIPYNLNGPAFTGWFEDEVSTFENKTIIIFGVGGVGEPIAREIAQRKVRRIYLIDINSKKKLEKELSKNIFVSYFENLNQIQLDNNNFILINCAGKEGADDKEIKKMIKKFKDLNNIFVDLRPQLNIDIVNYDRKQGWDSYTGFGMNSRNDYALLEKIKEVNNIEIPTFIEFAKLVKSVS